MSSSEIGKHGTALVVFERFHLGAAAEAAELERQIRGAVALLPGLADDKVRDLTETWLLDKADTSRKSYFLALADFLLWCRREDKDPLRAQRADTDRWKAQMTAQRRLPDNEIKLVKPAANTVSKRLSALSTWFGYLQDNDLDVTNPAARTKRPKRPKGSRYPALDTDELAQFLDWLLERAERINDEAAWRDAAMYHLMFYTGLRTAPITLAQFTDIGFESDGRQQHLVLHYIKKGGVPDFVPLVEVVLTVLHRYWSVRAQPLGIAAEDLTGFLFVTTPHPRRPELVGGKQMQQNRMFDHLRVLARQAGLESADTIALHSTRKTAGTVALANGATLPQVQDLLGHADPRTTRDGYDANRHRLGTSPVHTIAATVEKAHHERELAAAARATSSRPAAAPANDTAEPTHQSSGEGTMGGNIVDLAAARGQRRGRR